MNSAIFAVRAGGRLVKGMISEGSLTAESIPAISFRQ
jgi:hypothetical protein